VQQRRERENRQINERLRTLIAAYKTLGGSFTGDLSVDPAHLRDALSSYRQPQGLPFVMKYVQSGVGCEVMLGDAWRVVPSDGLQVSLKESFGQESVIVEY